MTTTTLKVATLNVNGGWEASKIEVKDKMKKHDIDICLIQETRQKRLKKDRQYNIVQQPAFHKKSQKYVSSGLATITKKKFIITEDEILSTQFMNITHI